MTKLKSTVGDVVDEVVQCMFDYARNPEYHDITVDQGVMVRLGINDQVCIVVLRCPRRRFVVYVSTPYGAHRPVLSDLEFEQIPSADLELAVQQFITANLCDTTSVDVTSNRLEVVGVGLYELGVTTAASFGGVRVVGSVRPIVSPLANISVTRHLINADASPVQHHRYVGGFDPNVDPALPLVGTHREILAGATMRVGTSVGIPNQWDSIELCPRGVSGSVVHVSAGQTIEDKPIENPTVYFKKDGVLYSVDINDTRAS